MASKSGFFDQSAIKSGEEKGRPKIEFDKNGNPTNLTRAQMKEADRRGGFDGASYAASQPKRRG